MHPYEYLNRLHRLAGFSTMTIKAKALGVFLGYFIYCLFIGWVGYRALDYWAAGELKKRVENGLPLYDGILVGDGDVLRTRAHFNGRWKAADFDNAIRTNARGFREDFDFEDEDIDIAFMGDSFTFGQGVDVEYRYSNRVAAAQAGRTVASLSYNNGFQPEHYEYFLQNHPDLHPKRLFVGLYLGNDLDADLKETVIERNPDGTIKSLQLPYRTVFEGALVNAPNYRYEWLSAFVRETNIGKLVGIRINASSSWRKRLMRVIPNQGNTLATERGEFDATHGRAFTALKRIDEVIKKRGGKVDVLLIPQNFLVGEVEHPHMARKLRDHAKELRETAALRKAVMQACVADELTCHDLAAILTPSDYLVEDGHWNAKGHAKAGEYVARLLDRQGGLY